MPSQNRSTGGKKIMEWLKIKVSRITLKWAGLKVQNGYKNLAIVHGRVRDDVEKNVNEEHRQKNNNNNKMKVNITKIS